MRWKLTQFDFDLPDKLLADFPSEYRDESRLMVIHKDTGEVEHRMFKDIVEYFDEGDCFVMNNTKVFPARLYGHKEKTGAKIEVFLLRELNKEMRLWDVLVDPARKIRVGNKLYFGEDGFLMAEVIDNTTSRGRTIRFLFDGTDEEFKEVITSLGNTPLPKYIDREPVDSDVERYQTLYAKEEGAVAAPTAGLHFSERVLKMMELKGIERAEITLHIGVGTFDKIEVEDLTKHKMDAEYVRIQQDAVEIVNKAKRSGKKVVSVGTTSLRATESAVSAEDLLKTIDGWTNLFIYPPYNFKISDALITNFHIPKSSLLILVSAFLGYDRTKEIYDMAIKEGYRFYSYGDAMLII